MVGITALLKVELPSGDVFLTDGGVTTWGGDTYTASDAVLGGLASVDTISEGIGAELPALDLEFSPPSAIAIGDLSTGAIQQKAVKLWVAEYDTDTGAVVGTPDLRFSGFIDQPQISIAFRRFTVGITAVPDLEAVFFRSTGNGLSSSFHKALYAGETGHDNATGLSVPVAWGTKSPRTGSGSTGGSGGGRTSPFTRDVVEY